jgi:hypothetical protein
VDVTQTGSDLDCGFGHAVDANGTYVFQSSLTPNMLVTGPLSRLETVRHFYALLNIGAYDQAFDLLSAERKAETSLEEFSDGYILTMAIRIDDVRDLGDVGVFVSVTALEAFYLREEIKQFQGTWGLVWESGRWKLDEPSIKQVK